MSLETVLIIIFLSPIVLGLLAALFDGSSPTPIIIDYRPAVPATTISQENSDSEEEFINHDPKLDPKLEESPEALEILQEIVQEGDKPASKPLEYEAYEASELPDAVNKSLDELFRAIDGPTTPPEREHSPVVENLNVYKALQSQPEVTPIVQVGIPDETAQVISSAEEFEATVPSIDDMLDQISSDFEDSGAKIYNFPFGENLPLPPREYWALQQKYGAEVVSKVTTTPGIGGTGDYDCMIGRVQQKEDMTLLQYGSHFIPLKGMENLEGVFLVEGMFIKPDLFFVSNYTDLAESTNYIVQAAEK
ncbi:hypothetical protein EHV15_34325 [Paenibacillus oralis]|uniref:Uncharacterized protein n=1 Tax=Paenibacillus oralis TaxID=2490856 RepID=A0A3P3T9G9_9BACL|nr:hypothetical protein [Paenibacillus oralis]RRJ54676.1 hypothetical protein EHV15_34325 [Paenibacillus oralis]